MLEIVRLRADIEKDPAVYKVLGNLEEHICEKVCQLMCMYIQCSSLSLSMLPACFSQFASFTYVIYTRWKKKQENLYAIQLRHKEFL